MWLRKILIAAAVVAPLALSPMDVFAQGRGAERSAAAHSQAAAVENGTHQLGGPTITELPAGIERVFAGRDLPPGLARRYSPPAPEPEPAEPETTPDTGADTPTEPDPSCIWEPAQDENGMPGTRNSCTGEFIAF